MIAEWTMDSIDLFYVGVVDVDKESIEEKVEMPPACWTNKGLMAGCYTKYIIGSLFHA